MRAKKKLTKLWSILLTLVMVVGMLPTTALATEPATVDFTTDTDAAIDALGGSSVAEWNGSTLTLKGVNFTTTAAIAVKLPADATIVLADGTTNTITGGNSASEGCYGIYAEGSLTISGSGTLNVTGGNTTGTANGSRSCGIYTDQALTISGGTVKAYGGATYKASLGIYSKNNITISGTADVTAIGGTATGDGSFGIDAEGEVIISGGKVTAIGGTGRGSDGLYSGSHKVTINGGTVMAIGGDAPSAGWSVGIYALNGTVTINGGTVTSAANRGADGTFLFKGNVTGSGYKTISFDKNGGSGEMKAYTTAAEYTLPANGFAAPEGKQLKGWSVNGTEKAVGDTITVTDGTTVKAIWENITYTVSFDANGGTGTMTDVTDVLGEYTLPANGFTAPAGQQFKGWATALNGSVISGTSITVTGNTTLYAIWENTKDLSSIAITTPPTKTTYTVGESFDTAGMVVKATYSDSTTAAVTGYTVSPSAALTTSDTSVTISYTEGGVTQTATQVITVNPAAPTGGGIYIPPTYKVESTVSEDADGTVTFSKTSAKKGDVVTITVTPDRYYKTSGVIVKDASGRMIAVTDNGNGTFTFQMPDSKVTVEPVFSWDNPFVDVAGDAYYAPAVEWALKNEVTDGTSDTTFSPDAGCTRGQIVTFLWRAAGCPEPAGMSSFTDVSADAYYAKAVAWAAEQGITGGTGDGKFSPDAVCTRGQIVTFLWRAEKSPAVGTANPFTDVEADAYYAGATNWAVENGITEGTGDGTTFSPANDCTRAQIVAFLYRYFVK